MPDAPPTNQSASTLKLSPPRAPLPDSFWSVHRRELALGIVFVFAAVAVWILLGKKKQPPVRVPPAVQARRELEALRQRAPDAALAVAVAQIIRRFIVGQLALPSQEFTTAELHHALRHAAGVPPEVAELAADFLRRCDAIKFSPDAPPPAPEIIAEALQVVEHLEKEAR